MQSLNALKCLLQIVSIEKQRFAFPAITISLVKVILGKKNTSALRADAIDLLGKLIVAIVGDKCQDLAIIRENIKKNQRNILIQQVCNVGKKMEEGIKIAKSEDSTSKGKFEIILSEEWLSTSLKKLKETFDHMLLKIYQLDLEKSGLKNSLQNFCCVLLIECRHSLSESIIILLKLFFISYFTQRDPEKSMEEFCIILETFPSLPYTTIQVFTYCS